VREHNLELPEDFLDKISEFCNLLLEANKATNLVSKNDEKKLLTRHVADSLIFAAYLGNRQWTMDNGQWADIGSGAGFPVVPLCIYFPQVKFYAIESRKKRCEFLNMVQQKLNFKNLEIIHSRAETSNLKNMDFVSSRAVGSLEEDFARAKKLLKKGGRFLTLKSKRMVDGLKAKNIWHYRLPQEEMEYALVELC
jgi:16S rRNA (guanine527-N7)-methyltransferase